MDFECLSGRCGPECGTAPFLGINACAAELHLQRRSLPCKASSVRHAIERTIRQTDSDGGPLVPVGQHGFLSTILMRNHGWLYTAATGLATQSR